MPADPKRILERLKAKRAASPVCVGNVPPGHLGNLTMSDAPLIPSRPEILAKAPQPAQDRRSKPKPARQPYPNDGRLPDQSSFAVVYHATDKQWHGALTVIVG